MHVKNVLKKCGPGQQNEYSRHYWSYLSPTPKIHIQMKKDDTYEVFDSFNSLKEVSRVKVAQQLFKTMDATQL